MKTRSITELQNDFERDKKYNQETREEAQDLLHFFYISHYTDEWRSSIPLQYQGQFDNLKKSARKIMADLISQEIQADFAPRDGTPPELSNLMDRLFRTDSRTNSSIEATGNAVKEIVPCGIGGWRWVNDWETNLIGDRNQVLKRVPIHEFNSRVFFDEAARMQDKSDARRVHIISGYSKESYEELREEMLGESMDEAEICAQEQSGVSSVAPVQGRSNYVDQDIKDIYVVESYYRDMVKKRINFYHDEDGNVCAYDAVEAKQNAQALKDEGKVYFDNKIVSVWEVTKTTWCGNETLKQQIIAGTHLPVVPVYGDRVFVNGIEHYEGITRSEKDPARMRDLMYSYLCEIATTSPRPKNIYLAGQIAGYEYMYDTNGPDDNYNYALQNEMDEHGRPYPVGPIGQIAATQLPTGLIDALTLINQTMAETSQAGAPNGVADVNLSGNAISQIRAMMDENSIVFRASWKIGLRRDAEIWASMAADIHGINKKVVATNKDGTTEEIWLQEKMYDYATGEERTMNDLSKSNFEVFVELGDSYASQQQQERQEIATLLQTEPAGTESHDILMLKYVALSNWDGSKDIKKYANRQLLLKGIKEPENEQEMAELDAARQAQANQKDPNLELAKAEQMKAENGTKKLMIDFYNAETNRKKVEIEAAKAHVDIELKNTQIANGHISNVQQAFSRGETQTAA